MHFSQWMTLPAENTMDVHECIAIDFPRAFPPTVRPATRADMAKLTKLPADH